MSGTLAGGRKASATIKVKYGANFYSQIGRVGGKNGHTGGFAAGEEGRRRASYWGKVGGRRSKRTDQVSIKHKESFITRLLRLRKRG